MLLLLINQSDIVVTRKRYCQFIESSKHFGRDLFAKKSALRFLFVVTLLKVEYTLQIKKVTKNIL